MQGFLLIDKPEGITSHDVVDRVRRLTGEKRVGHAGTLDPFATGLLIVGVGRVATREFQKLVGLDKEYEAVFTLGATSDTDDRTGNIHRCSSVEGESDTTGSDAEPHGTSGKAGSGFAGKVPVKSDPLATAMRSLTGTIAQVPPAYSAIKIAGKKMYELAREGKEVERKPRTVTIHSFDLLEDQGPTNIGNLIRVRISCSSGTYIRSIARDLGQALGSGGYVQELRRTVIGSFAINEAVMLGNLTKDNVSTSLLPIESVLSRVPNSGTVPA
jgi:tRNA pseudouridine55 synthase